MEFGPVFVWIERESESESKEEIRSETGFGGVCSTSSLQLRGRGSRQKWERKLKIGTILPYLGKKVFLSPYKLH